MRKVLTGLLVISCGLVCPVWGAPSEMELMEEQRERMLQEIRDLEKEQPIRGLRGDPKLTQQIWEKKGELIELEIQMARLQARMDREEAKEQRREEREAEQVVRRLEKQIGEAQTIAEAADLLPIAEQELKELTQAAIHAHNEYRLGLRSYDQLISARGRVYAQRERVKQLEHIINPLGGEDQ